MRKLTNEEFGTLWGAVYASILTFGFWAMWPHAVWWAYLAAWCFFLFPATWGARANHALNKATKTK